MAPMFVTTGDFDKIRAMNPPSELESDALCLRDVAKVKGKSKIINDALIRSDGLVRRVDCSANALYQANFRKRKRQTDDDRRQLVDSLQDQFSKSTDRECGECTNLTVHERVFSR